MEGGWDPRVPPVMGLWHSRQSWSIRVRVSAEGLAASDYKSIHRHICDYFRSTLPSGSRYHLAPFSIKT